MCRCLNGRFPVGHFWSCTGISWLCKLYRTDSQSLPIQPSNGTTRYVANSGCQRTGVTFAAVSTFVLYAFDPLDHSKFKMFYDGDRVRANKLIFNRTVSKQIMKFHSKSKSILYLLIWLQLSSVLGYFYTNIWFNSVYRVTCFSLIYWLVLFPVQILYYSFGKLSSF